MCPPVPLPLVCPEGARPPRTRGANARKLWAFCTFELILPYWVYRSGDAEVPFRGPGLNRPLLIDIGKTMANSNAPVVSNEQLMELVLKLKAENEALKAAKPAGRSASITLDKLGRMSVQLEGSVAFAFYLDQWERFEPMIDKAKAFIKANREKMPDEATRKAASKARKEGK